MLTTTELRCVHFEALRLADLHERFHPSSSLGREYRHIARDCEWAEHGCEESAASVEEWLAGDHELWMATVFAEPTAAESTCVWGMA